MTFASPFFDTNVICSGHFQEELSSDQVKISPGWCAWHLISSRLLSLICNYKCRANSVRMIQGTFSRLLVNPSLIMRSTELPGQYLILNNEVTPARYSLRTNMSARPSRWQCGTSEIWTSQARGMKRNQVSNSAAKKWLLILHTRGWIVLPQTPTCPGSFHDLWCLTKTKAWVPTKAPDRLHPWRWHGWWNQARPDILDVLAGPDFKV